MEEVKKAEKKVAMEEVHKNLDKKQEVLDQTNLFIGFVLISLNTG